MAKVIIPQGVLGGCQHRTQNGFEYLSFLQIPYASPPVGKLRFKSPQPPEPWKGERFITKTDSKYICRQADLSGSVLGSEDCLYLNVYTPRLPNDSNDSALPVIFNIHAGGFVTLNGTMFNEKKPNLPDHLIERNVVVVSINYRLGVFGFLSLDMPDAAGNMGLKDQVMALQWVQSNITIFGGDKNNVTIFGVSAGGASVEYHMLSPLSKNLFAKGISLSGSALNHWALQDDIEDLSVQLAMKLGYKGAVSDSRGIHQYLMQQSTEELFAVSQTLTYKYKSLEFGFVPSIEKDFGNGEAFLTERPYVLLKRGHFQRVPLIRGFCESEAAMTQLICPAVIDQLKRERKFTEFMKYIFSNDDVNRLNDSTKKQYFDGHSDEDSIEAAALDFFSHYDFIAGIITNAKIIASFDVPVYLYKFAFLGSISVLEFCCKLKRKVAVHADDSGYIMAHDFEAEINKSEQDILMTKRMTKMIVDFARTGNPTPEISDVVPLLWTTYNDEQQTYLEIDQVMQLKNKYQPERINIFTEIYEKCKH